MGILSLIGRLDLNAAPFHSALKSAEGSTEHLAHHIKRHLGREIVSILAGRELMHLGKEAIEQGHHISELAKKFNLTTTEVQLLQKEAEETGTSFEELVKDSIQLEQTLDRIRGGDALLSRSQVENLERAHQIIVGFKEAVVERFAHLLGGEDNPELTDRQKKFLEADAKRRRARDPEAAAKAHMAMMDRVVELDKQAAEFQNKAHDAGLTKQEKMNELLRKQAELRKENFKDWVNEEVIAKKNLEIAKNDSEIAILKKDMANDSKVKPLDPLSDSLSKIGNFLGSDPSSPMIKQMSEQTKELREIKRILSKTSSAPSIFPP